MLRELFARAGVCLLVFSAVALSQKPPSSGVDVGAMDRTVNPCQDFYKFACGNWMRENPIPAQYAVWGRFQELADRNQEVLHQILEDSAKHQDRSPIDQKIGAFYGSCMDEAGAEKKGDEPVMPEIERIRAMKDKSDLAAEIAQLHRQGVPVLFTFGPEPDPDKSTIEIADADQGGLGLPDRSYYLEAKDEQRRKKYAEHVSKMFQLLGDSAPAADAKANAILELETALAKGSLDRVSRRDPHLTHHSMQVAEFEALIPTFNFKQYLAERHAPEFTTMNVSVPDFFKALNAAIDSTTLDDLKSYVIWHEVSHYAPLLSKPFVDLNFEFYGRYLTGAQELQPRWKRCVQLTDRNLGEALGQKYVEKAFAGESKQKTQQLVNIIETEMETDIKSLSWMSDTTKQQALAKLHGVTNKIGYPAKWRDYSSVKIVDGDLVGDAERAAEFEQHRNLTKIGQLVDRSEFGMTPPTVNAYYSPPENNINFPAGILQPPFYTSTADMAVNFGGIGAVIGHELTHGFDDQGRQFDADGNLRDWWTSQDGAEFKKRADCVANEYSSFSPVAGENINGRLTLGENGADNAGVRLAYLALLGGMENGTVDKDTLDGFTPQQRFFLGYAQIWCQNQRPEALRTSLRTNPHSPGEFRVIGVVENMPEFAKAFGCSAGQPMVAANGCRVW
ncbi:MAG TPA: M13 family metallopeptidase [Bryobacteraceae bacterium]|jgi:endothelin-converting enzyme/putative endopeptidase|nr:M13 family metallopeptidase [Bryobacteraceae bacterium]